MIPFHEAQVRSVLPGDFLHWACITGPETGEPLASTDRRLVTAMRTSAVSAVKTHYHRHRDNGANHDERCPPSALAMA
jgi:Ornithine cyclodeaminase/mu-crystallin family